MGQVGAGTDQRRRPRWLPGALALGLLGSVGVVVWTFTRPRSLPASPLLVVPPLLLLLAAQVAVGSRLRRARGVRRGALAPLLAGALSSPTGMVLALTALAGLLASWSGLRLAPGGTPADPRPGCPYPLVSRGHVVCVGPDHYRLAGLGGERFAAGVVVLLMAVHLAVALTPPAQPAER
ncbi:hypothetical protein [Pedococcus bigeumensis]|uniref:hypothetical protein n=1 Tax=Pedococcus bigeumensis TaxID=433644 RepID=UPI002FED5B36